MFPNRRASGFCRNAPLLNDDLLKWFHEDPTRLDKVMQVAKQTLYFWGVETTEEKNTESGCLDWKFTLKNENSHSCTGHNRLRMSRMLRFLAEVGLFDFSLSIFEFFKKFDSISQENILFWLNAIDSGITENKRVFCSVNPSDSEGRVHETETLTDST